jgi:uncharacterized protein YyaL (SSP411 family)
VQRFAAGLAETPASQSTLLVALARLRTPPSTLTLIGDAREMREWQRRLEKRYRPELAIVPLAMDAPPEALRKGERPPRGVAAFLCHGSHCLPPLDSVEAVEAQLAASR